MTNNRVYNFAAGPSVMPESVLARAGAEIMNFKGSGMSVMEMSHRSSVYAEIFAEAKSRLKHVLSVPDTHEILFYQGGATLQFAGIPMNLMTTGTADYAITGNFSGKAAKEAEKYGSCHVVYTSESTGHNRIPTQSELQFGDNASYFYYCANNTIYGTEWQYIPEPGTNADGSRPPLVCDMSSDILSRPVDVSRFGLIYAGAQKNMAPAGLTVLILQKDLAGHELPITPEVMSYQVMLKHDSMLNTPPSWCIYMLSLTLEWMEQQGGLTAMEALRSERARLIYDVIDDSAFYIGRALPEARSGMNVTFRTPSPELDAAFVREAADRGMVNLKGHRVSGGLRASLYNAMPIEGAQALAEFMKDFEVRYHV